MPGEKPQSRFAPKLNVNTGAVDALQTGRNLGIVREILDQTPEPVEKPKAKGGRPKGIPKTKKTFYLATDLTRLEETQINLSRHASIRTKDESDTVDLALELLDHMAGLPEYAALINTIHKKRLNK